MTSNIPLGLDSIIVYNVPSSIASFSSSLDINLQIFFIGIIYGLSAGQSRNGIVSDKKIVLQLSFGLFGLSY